MVLFPGVLLNGIPFGEIMLSSLLSGSWLMFDGFFPLTSSKINNIKLMISYAAIFMWTSILFVSDDGVVWSRLQGLSCASICCSCFLLLCRKIFSPERLCLLLSVSLGTVWYFPSNFQLRWWPLILFSIFLEKIDFFVYFLKEKKVSGFVIVDCCCYSICFVCFQGFCWEIGCVSWFVFYGTCQVPGVHGHFCLPFIEQLYYSLLAWSCCGVLFRPWRAIILYQNCVV